VIGVSHLPLEEQEREAKRFRDRINARRRRAE
jgi:hypothetical protein